MPDPPPTSFGVRVSIPDGFAGLPEPVYDCLHAVAVTDPATLRVGWDGSPPRLAPDEVLLLLAPAMLRCAFVAGSGAPRVVGVERDADDVVAHVGFGEDFSIGAVASVLPRPARRGRLRLVVHGCFMRPPGRWEDAREFVVAVDAT